MIYTIKQLIKNGVHLGHYKWECDYRLSYFLIGLRNSIHIINLYYTLFILKKVLYIAYNVCLLGHRILITNNVGYKLSLNFEKLDKKQLWFINNKWTGGLLCNQKEIFFNNEKLFLEFYNLGYNSLLPSYVFASNVKETSSCIFESVILNIPCSSFIDSNMGFYGIFYGIPGNDDNFVSIYLFTRLFVKMYLKSIYDNINVLKVIKEDNGIKLDFIFENLPDIKVKYKKKYYTKNRIENEEEFWNKEGQIKKKIQNKIILGWKLRKKKKKKKWLKPNLKSFKKNKK